MAIGISHKVQATHLVLSCIDHRCTDDLVSVIPDILNDAENAWDRYDLISLPGASKGVMQTARPSWGEAFWDQLGVALSLHTHIDTVVVVDHLECGAYRHFHPGYEADMEGAHREVTAAFAAEVQRRHAGLKVERWLLEPALGSDLTWEARCLGTDGLAERVVRCSPH